MAGSLIVLTGVAIWQYLHAVPASGAINWADVPRRDLVTAALYLDVQEGGPGLALDHLATLAERDTAIMGHGHAYAHEVGRYALARNGGDPRVYASCTPRFRSGCYHGLIEAYVNKLPRLEQTELAELCAQIAGSVMPEVARRECAHGLGHGLWFRLNGKYRDALVVCDRLSTPVGQEECRDGVFMQRAGSAVMHAHGATTTTPVSLGCSAEPQRYRSACWHYQGRLFVPVGGYSKAFAECSAAAEYARVCYWGLGKWIAGEVTNARGTDEEIVRLCGRADPAMLGPCLSGAVEALVDENWTIGPAERLCHVSPEAAQSACYAKLRERSAILRSVRGSP
jgi:hypothetical protein